MEQDEQLRGEAPGRSRLPFFQRPFFLSLTIGIPFCTFKFLFGITAVRVAGLPGISPLLVLGGAVVAWAFADLAMNAGRAIFDLFGREAPFEYCTIAQMGTIFGMSTVFLAVDTLVTFTIICAMLWSGWITLLGTFESWLWYGATTLNLISLSLVSLYAETKRVKDRV
ncbi:MAG: hypothetical protein NQU46_02945 [Methanolinea sp.]|nr:hypothetical protein [Methanolinea sp.]